MTSSSRAAGLVRLTPRVVGVRARVQLLVLDQLAHGRAAESRCWRPATAARPCASRARRSRRRSSADSWYFGSANTATPPAHHCQDRHDDQHLEQRDAARLLQTTHALQAARDVIPMSFASPCRYSSTPRLTDPIQTAGLTIWPAALQHVTLAQLVRGADQPQRLAPGVARCALEARVLLGQRRRAPADSRRRGRPCRHRSRDARPATWRGVRRIPASRCSCTPIITSSAEQRRGPARSGEHAPAR